MFPVDLFKLVDELETYWINEALRASGGSRTIAAQYLSMNRTTLVEKMRKRGMIVPHEKRGRRKKVRSLQ